MRILFTGTIGDSLPPPYGGIPKRALMLAGLWRPLGHAVGFTFVHRQEREDDLGAAGEYFFEFTRKPTKTDKLFFLFRQALADPALYAHLFAVCRRTYKVLSRETFFYPAYGVFLDGVCKSFRPTVIVAEAALIQSFVAAHVAKRRGIPFVLETYAEVHDREMNKLQAFNEEERTRYWKDFLQLADRIIGPSQYCAKGPLAYADPDKVKVIYATTLNIAPYAETVDGEGKRALRRAFGLPEDRFCVMSVGAFTPRKGHDHLIEAVARLRGRGLELGIILCGAGDPAEWKRLATERGIADSLFIFQRLSEEELIKLYKCADVYCDASNTPRACLGIALTEALASRLPALAYDAGGLPEVVHDGQNGYLVPLNDIDKLAEGLVRLFRLSIEERKAMGEAGFARAQEVFDLSVISPKLLVQLETVSKRV